LKLKLTQVNHGGKNIIPVAQGENAKLSSDDILALENIGSRHNADLTKCPK